MEISPILARVPAAATGGAQLEGQKTFEVFGSALAEAISSLGRLQQEADARSLAVASSEPVELHEVWLAQQRARLSFELAIQVQNKLVEAYRDIMRMQM